MLIYQQRTRGRGTGVHPPARGTTTISEGGTDEGRMRDGVRDGERDGGGGVPEVRWRVIGCGRWLDAKGVAQCKAGGNRVGVIAVSFMRSGSVCTPTQNVRGGVPRAVLLKHAWGHSSSWPMRILSTSPSFPILPHPVLSCLILSYPVLALPLLAGLACFACLAITTLSCTVHHLFKSRTPSVPPTCPPPDVTRHSKHRHQSSRSTSSSRSLGLGIIVHEPLTLRPYPHRLRLPVLTRPLAIRHRRL